MDRLKIAVCCRDGCHLVAGFVAGFLSALIFVLFFHSLYGSFIDTVFFESSRHRYEAVHNLSGEAAQFASLCTQHFGVVGSHHEEFLAAVFADMGAHTLYGNGFSHEAVPFG